MRLFYITPTALYGKGRLSHFSMAFCYGVGSIDTGTSDLDLMKHALDTVRSPLPINGIRKLSDLGPVDLRLYCNARTWRRKLSPKRQMAKVSLVFQSQARSNMILKASTLSHVRHLITHRLSLPPPA